MPANAFSAPALCWTVITPIRRPLVVREKPSAMFSATRSCRATIGQRLDDRREGKTENVFDTFNLQNLRDGLTAEHCGSPRLSIVFRDVPQTPLQSDEHVCARQIHTYQVV